MKDESYQRGQVLLVVVLVMVVVLTVALALTSRSITNLRNATDEEHSQKAFSAAEAGIEQFLQQGCVLVEGGSECSSIGSPSLFDDNKSRFSAVATPVSGSEFLLNGGNPVAKDNGVDIWLSDYSEDPSQIYQNPWRSGNLTIYWGDLSLSDDCQQAAIEVIVIYGSKTSPYTSRSAFDKCGGRENNFSTPAECGQGGCMVSNVKFKYKANVTGIKDGLIAKVIPLYSNARIAVEGTDAGRDKALPAQGIVISSTGYAGETTRKIRLIKGYPSLPSEFFGYILFSTIDTEDTEDTGQP